MLERLRTGDALRGVELEAFGEQVQELFVGDRGEEAGLTIPDFRK